MPVDPERNDHRWTMLKSVPDRLVGKSIMVHRSSLIPESRSGSVVPIVEHLDRPIDREDQPTGLLPLRGGGVRVIDQMAN
jgi:hypothetical protein